MLKRGKVLGGDGFEHGCQFKFKGLIEDRRVKRLCLRAAVKANLLISEKNYAFFLLCIQDISSKRSRNFQNVSSVSTQMIVAAW